VAHQLRNPLNAITSWVYLLRSGQLDAEETRQGLDALQRSARAQERMLDRLLDLSRLLCGRFELASQAVDLSLVVESALASREVEVAGAGVRLVRDLRPGCAVAGDPERLQQAVTALLDNAVKFAPGGKVDVQLQTVRPAVRLVVSDDGVGIAANHLPRIFSSFSHPDSGRHGHTDDLGIDLAIARGLVELHGGTVMAASDGPGRGATFTIELPLGPLATGPDDTATPLTFAALTGHRLLLVADQSSARSLLRSALGSCGAEIVTGGTDGADDGQESLPPTVVVIDRTGPAGESIRLLARAREWARSQQTSLSVIALWPTAEGAVGDLPGGPYDRVLLRPCRLTDLIAAIAATAAATARPSR
jgi:CheY-like chemotaxis protein